MDRLVAEDHAQDQRDDGDQVGGERGARAADARDEASHEDERDARAQDAQARDGHER